MTFDDLATAKGFAKQRGLQWPILAEAQPLIDADGRVRAMTHSAAIPPKGAKLDVGSLSNWVARNRKKSGSG